MVNLLFPVWRSSVSMITSWSTHVAAKAVLRFRGWVLFHGTDWLHLPVRASVQAAFGACSCHQCRVNFEAHLSFQIMVFLDIRLRSGVARQRGSSVFSVSRTSTLFSIVAAACIHSSKRDRRVLFHACPCFPAFLVNRLFVDSHCDWCEEIPSCSFDS